MQCKCSAAPSREVSACRDKRLLQHSEFVGGKQVCESAAKLCWTGKERARRIRARNGVEEEVGKGIHALEFHALYAKLHDNYCTSLSCAKLARGIVNRS